MVGCPDVKGCQCSDSVKQDTETPGLDALPPPAKTEIGTDLWSANGNYMSDPIENPFLLRLVTFAAATAHALQCPHLHILICISSMTVLLPLRSPSVECQQLGWPRQLTPINFYHQHFCVHPLIVAFTSREVLSEGKATGSELSVPQGDPKQTNRSRTKNLSVTVRLDFLIF